MSLIVKYEDVFQWKSASKMNRKALIEELKRLRKLVEDHYWEVQSEIDEFSNRKHQDAEIKEIIKEKKKKTRRLVNQANSKKPRKIKIDQRAAIVKEYREYKAKNKSSYGFYPFIKKILEHTNRDWGRKAINKVLRESGLK
jgi:chromosome segregation ATPase